MNVSTAEVEDSTIYKVVVNHEEQYSIWPERRENPRGWTSPGVKGSKAECLSYIESVWTDMRPLSLRKAMEQRKAAPPKPQGSQKPEPSEESLPVRLSRGLHPVEVPLRPDRNTEAFLTQLKTGCIPVRFTATRGGTELTVPLEPGVAQRISEQVAGGEQTVRVSGGMSLDYIKVRCVADIDLSTLTGTGRLEILQ